MVQFKQGGSRKKNAHFLHERGRAWLTSMEGLRWARGDQRGAKGKPLLAQEAWIKRWRLCVCVCAWVAQPWSFPWKLGSLLTNELNQHFFSYKPLFYRMRVGFMQLAPIPTFSNYFSLCLCVWLAHAAGFSFSVSSSLVYSKASLMYLSPVFTHYHIQWSLIWTQILAKVDYKNFTLEKIKI